MFFFCGFVPIWWISFYFMRVFTIILESQFFPFKQVLYYVIGVRVSQCLVRTCVGNLTNLTKYLAGKDENTAYEVINGKNGQFGIESKHSSM